MATSDPKKGAPQDVVTDSSGQPVQQQVQQQEPKPVLTTPVYFGRRGRKGGKRRRNKRYSRGTKAAQRFAYGSEWAAYRTANAFAKGFRTFARRSSRSARRRRDGMLRDSFRNASRGFANAANELGRAPGEIAWRIGTGNVRRALVGFNAFNPLNFFVR